MADRHNEIERAATNKKRRQHYVWRHYLDGWATCGKVWCQHRGSVFDVSSQNVAHERDFYRLREMSERDLALVRQVLIEPLQSPLRELAEGWIPHFTELFRLKELCQHAGRSDKILEAEFDAHINNLEEDLHARLETQAHSFLVALRNCDISILDDVEQAIHHTWFIAAQYFRTPGMLARVMIALQDLQDFNVEAAFGLMRTIMSTTFGHGLWLRRSGLHATFIRANGSATFITGDQPIVNIRGVGLVPNTPPTSLELYYPLLPKLAVLLDFDAGTRATSNKLVSNDEVAAFNRIIVDMSYNQVYGTDRNSVSSP